MKDRHIFAKLTGGLSGQYAASGCAAALALLLVGCASKLPAPVVERNVQPVLSPSTVATPVVAPSLETSSKDFYTVKKGDTLYGIALDHGLDYKDLVNWNAIENPNRILVGQQLRVTSPQSTGAEPATVKPVTLTPPVEKRALENGANAANGANASSATSAANTNTMKYEPRAGKEPYSDQALAQAQQQALVQQKPVEQQAPLAAAPENKAAVKNDLKPEAAVGGEEFAWIWPANGKLVGTFSEGASKGIDIAGKAGDPILAAGDGKVVYSGTGLRGYGKLIIIKHNNTYLSAYAHNQNILLKEGQSVSKGQKIAEMGNTDADQVKLHFEVRRQGKPVDPLKYLPQR